jgi:short-subunit dehydrogenase
VGPSQSEFRERYGPWALVAGGSMGIGLAFAEQLAARGLDVLNIAEVADPLAEVCAQIADEQRVEVRPLVIDLGRPDLHETLQREVAGLDVGLVVCNAARVFMGSFLDQSLEDKLALLDVNCRAALILAHEFAPRLVARGRGGMIFMSSLSGLVGTPFVTAYASSKAFDMVLGEALWSELEPRGVDVLSVIAGPTRTPAFESAGHRSGRFQAPVMEPRDVVAESLAALGRTPSLVPGRANRVTQALLSRILPRRRAVQALRRSMRAQFGEKIAGSAAPPRG